MDEIVGLKRRSSVWEGQSVNYTVTYKIEITRNIYMKKVNFWLNLRFSLRSSAIEQNAPNKLSSRYFYREVNNKLKKLFLENTKLFTIRWSVVQE